MPSDAPRLCCDRMLAGLARWLRAAGYDTMLVAAEQTDRAIAAKCREERRVLVTRDRHLAAHAGSGIDILLLGAVGTDAQAIELADALGIDWTRAPFTRCMLDNSPLEDANATDRARVPPSAAGLPGPFRRCPACGRVYWPGSHARRIAARLARWREGVA